MSRYASKKASYWMTHYNELVEYKRQFGDCCVSSKYKSNPKLAYWVANQRKYFKSKSLTEDRIAKLDEIGFTWEVDNEAKWMTRYKELIEYKHEFGHCNVMRKCKRNRQLGRWVHKQRELFKNKALQEIRVAKLNQIGFAWQINTASSYEASWMTQYEGLVEYKRMCGDCCVPHQWKTNPQLANWVRRQRQLFKRKSLADDHMALLNRIGFTWELFNKDEVWMIRYNELVEYKHQFGDCCVPKKGYKENLQLANWVQTQRRFFKRKSLADDRIALLNKIGFTWEFF